MPKEVFIDIIRQNIILLFGMLFLYFLVNTIILKLVLKFHTTTIPLIRLFPFSFCLSLYNIFGKQFFPNPIYAIIYIALLSFTLWFFSRISVVKALITTLLVMLITTISAILTTQPLVIYNKNIMTFLTTTPIGVAIESLLEAFLPTILLLNFPLLKMSFPYSKNKFKWTKADIYGMILFAIMFFMIYYLGFLFLWIYKNIPNSNLTVILFLELILFFFAWVTFFYISKNEQKRQLANLEQNRLKSELEQSHQLIETLSSERRDFRNHLQVMNMLATMNNNSELSRYIFDITKQLAVSSIISLDNPILASVIITNQIQVKENGISIVLHCDTSLKRLTDNSVKLGELIQIILKILTENELLYTEGSKMVFININQESDKYIFEFYNSGFNSIYKPKSSFYNIQQTKESMSAKLSKAIKITKELEGCLLYAIQDNYLVWFELLIKKTDAKS